MGLLTIGEGSLGIVPVSARDSCATGPQHPPTYHEHGFRWMDFVSTITVGLTDTGLLKSPLHTASDQTHIHQIAFFDENAGKGGRPLKQMR